MRDWSEAEAKIDNVVNGMRERGKIIPTKIRDIPDFPYDDFETMKRELVAGQILFQKFSIHFESTIASSFASGWQGIRLTCYPLLFIALPISGIVLAFAFSWWWLFLIPVGINFRTRFKRLYQRVIFLPAFESEKIFCFLFHLRQISLVTPDFSGSVHWGETSAERSGSKFSPAA